MDEQLSKKLSDCGVKKSVIEAINKMPKNSLAGMMNGTRPTPEKWATKLQEYVDNLIPLPSDYVKCKGIKVLSGGVVEELKNLPPLPFPIPEHPLFPEPWVKLVENYCGEIGMNPVELIADHKRMAAIKSMPIIKIKEEPNKVIVNDLNEQSKPKGGYNPFSNPRFKKLHGDKAGGEGQD